jgi:hypothetical protein
MAAVNPKHGVRLGDARSGQLCHQLCRFDCGHLRRAVLGLLLGPLPFVFLRLQARPTCESVFRQGPLPSGHGWQKPVGISKPCLFNVGFLSRKLISRPEAFLHLAKPQHNLTSRASARQPGFNSCNCNCCCAAFFVQVRQVFSDLPLARGHRRRHDLRVGRDQ